MNSDLSRFLKRVHLGETFKLASPSVFSIPLTLISVPLCLSSIGAASYGVLILLFLLQNQCHILLFGAEKNLIRSIIQKRTTLDNMVATMLIAFLYGVCLIAVATILVLFLGGIDYLPLSSTTFRSC